jgi:cysteinyl-tRNA synthetase
VLGLENLLEPAVLQVPPLAQELSDARERARAARDYAESDRLRERLAELGWEVRDGPQGPELLPSKSFPP